MKILAIDTATEACSAALLLDGRVTERFTVQPRGHGDLILGMMEELLQEAGLPLRGLDALAFGRGPGAFTGVRIATGVVQGAAYGSDLPVVPVSNLAALAQQCLREHGARRILAALDARMNEVYWGAFEDGGDGRVRPVGAEQVAAPDAVLLPEAHGWCGAGKGWEVYGEVLAQRLEGRLASVHAELLCRARDIAELAAAAFAGGQAVPAEQALPVYLRDQVAWKKTP